MPKYSASKKNNATRSSGHRSKYAPVWIVLACCVVVATAVLFFTLQRVEQEQSLAAVEAQAAKAKIIAPCPAAAEAYGVKPKDVQETFAENIRSRGVWQIHGTDAANTRTNGGELVFEVNNKNKGFNNAYVGYDRDIVGDANFQTVVHQMRYEGVRKGTGDAYGQMHVQFYNKARRQLSESVLRVREVKNDGKKWEAELLYRDNTALNAPWESLGKQQFDREMPLKLRFTRKGETLYGMVKNADAGATSMTVLGMKNVPKDLYVRGLLALDSIRNEEDPAQRLRIRYRNFRAFCPPDLPIEADPVADTE